MPWVTFLMSVLGLVMGSLNHIGNGVGDTVLLLVVT